MKSNHKYPINYAFIDSQNLNLGLKKDIRKKSGKIVYKGWQLDYRKFRQYLTDKFKVAKAFLFIGYIKENRQLYHDLKSFGYELVFKPTTTDSLGKPKGNIDAELVLHAAAIEFINYDKAIIVSGDGDFYCLHEYLEKKNKLLSIVIPNSKGESTLLRKFQQYKFYVEYKREKLQLEYKK
jgi:uncharacterized LabA/DUF88 family protein